MADRTITMSTHAREAIRRRGLDPALIVEVATMPQQIEPVRAGREVRQSRYRDSSGLNIYLIRVIVDVVPPRVDNRYRVSH
jgi:hypothetical protein